MAKARALKCRHGGLQVVKFSDPDVDFRIKNGMMWKEMDALLNGGSLLSVQVMILAVVG